MSFLIPKPARIVPPAMPPVISPVSFCLPVTPVPAPAAAPAPTVRGPLRLIVSAAIVAPPAAVVAPLAAAPPAAAAPPPVNAPTSKSVISFVATPLASECDNAPVT